MNPKTAAVGAERVGEALRRHESAPWQWRGRQRQWRHDVTDDAVHDESSADDYNDEGVTEDDVAEIKHDISALRYELLEVFRSNGMKLPSTCRKRPSTRTSKLSTVRRLARSCFTRPECKTVRASFICCLLRVIQWITLDWCCNDAAIRTWRVWLPSGYGCVTTLDQLLTSLGLFIKQYSLISVIGK